MKKILFAIIFILAIASVNYVQGYSTDYIEFEIPTGYSIELGQNDIDYKSYILSNNDENDEDRNIIIGITSHNDTGRIEYIEEDLNKLATGIISELNNTTLISKNITKINGSKDDYQCYYLTWKTETFGTILYQWQYHIASDNYIYTITSTSLDSNQGWNAYKFLRSINIKDTITYNSIENTSNHTITTNELDDTTSNIIIELLINLIFTVLIYESLPFILRFVMKKSYSEKEAKKIAIKNSICVYTLITCLYIFVLQEPKVANVVPALLWGTVAFNILKSNKKENQTEKEDEVIFEL